MKIMKKIIIYTAIIIAVLSVAYFAGGEPAQRGESSSAVLQKPSDAIVKIDEPATTAASTEAASIAPKENIAEQKTAPSSETSTESPAPSSEPVGKNNEVPSAENAVAPLSPEASTEAKTESTPSEAPLELKPEVALSEAPDEKDKAPASPASEETPAPVEPQEAVVTDKQMVCFISVSCQTILNNIEKLNSEKIGLVPADGVIFPSTEVIFYEGESVFNVLQREMKKNKIHMEFVNTPLYNSAYIEGINNLYEFDCGELSGWMYKVNGWFPNYGCSRYKLQPGDVIEWIYTCDLGRDAGDQYFSFQGQKQQ